MRPLERGYGLGRLAFGAALMASPEGLGQVLMGDQARQPAVRMNLRFYGTRDVVLGLGTLRATTGEDGAGPWLAAGVASDLLDAAVLLTEWRELPPGKRLPGVAAALTAACAGVALLARR